MFKRYIKSVITAIKGHYVDRYVIYTDEEVLEALRQQVRLTGRGKVVLDAFEANFQKTKEFVNNPMILKEIGFERIAPNQFRKMQ